MAPKGRTTAKNWSVERDFADELAAARRAFMESEPDKVWELLNGNVAEGVFLQMVARVGMAAIAESEKARASMWDHVPATARGYRP